MYAFCRRADDAVDNENDNAVALRRVERLRGRLQDVYGGRIADDPIDRAFAAVVERHAIPRALPEALLAGMEMDARGQRYDDDAALRLYCFRVASTVGLMMTRVMGAAAEIAYVHAADLGLAMQLTNIARDVGEDARRGRVYLPADLCDQLELDTAALATLTEASRPLKSAVQAILDEAWQRYRSADHGIPLLPRDCRLAIASSRHIYAGIGDAIAANDYDTIRTRAYVSTAGKLWRILRALPAVWREPAGDATRRAGEDAELRALVRSVGLPA